MDGARRDPGLNCDSLTKEWTLAQHTSPNDRLVLMISTIVTVYLALLHSRYS